MILYQDEVVGTTSEDGRFTFTVTEELERITVTVKAPNGTNLTDTTQTLFVTKAATGAFFFELKLLEKAPMVMVNASEPIVVSANAMNSGKRLGDVVIPANVLFDEDGEPVEVR